MKYNKITSFMIFCFTGLVSYSVNAQDLTTKMNLTKVTLFLKGAELQGQSSIKVPKGENEILLTNVANSINPNSINININNKAMILSTTVIDNYIFKKDDISEKIKSLNDKLKQLQEERDSLNVQLNVIHREIAMLNSSDINVFLRQEKTLAETNKIMGFIKDNLVTVLTEENTIKSKIAEIDQDIEQYNKQIALEEGKKSNTQRVIKMKIYAEKAISLPISLSYLTPDAGWMPTYDVRVKDITSPLVLTYKANIYQNSGLDWNNIDMVLSTANPNEGISVPKLEPWRVFLNEGNNSFNIDKDYSLGAAVSVSSSLKADSRQVALKNRKQFTDYVIPNNNGINTQFNIKLPFTIRNNSENNILTLNKKDIQAEYSYFAVPKLDNNAFLQAHILDWDNLSILPGKSTVFFAGNYVGEDFITTAGVKDKLNISLGRDKAILINRNNDLNNTSKPSFFGNEISRQFAYTIDIRNTKNQPINIIIYDQIPLIQNKVISLNETKYPDAQYNKDTGLLTWELTLDAKEVKQLPFSFKVSYPKNRAGDIIGF